MFSNKNLRFIKIETSIKHDEYDATYETNKFKVEDFRDDIIRLFNLHDLKKIYKIMLEDGHELDEIEITVDPWLEGVYRKNAVVKPFGSKLFTTSYHCKFSNIYVTIINKILNNTI